MSLDEERIKSLKAKTDKESRTVHNEFMEFVRFQANLEEKSRISFDELSVTQTLYRCIQESVVPSSTLPVVDWRGSIKDMVKRLKLPETMYWQLRLQCYADLNRFDLVRTLAAERQSPIGYLPFALACIEYGFFA